MAKGIDIDSFVQQLQTEDFDFAVWDNAGRAELKMNFMGNTGCCPVTLKRKSTDAKVQYKNVYMLTQCAGSLDERSGILESRHARGTH
jgi:hypothetical protein